MIELPLLVGGAGRAVQYVDKYVSETTSPHYEQSVVVSCRGVRSMSPTFAQELLRQIIIREGFLAVVLRGASGGIKETLSDAAEYLDVSDYVLFLPTIAAFEPRNELVECICNKWRCSCGAAQRRTYVERHA